MSLVREFLLFIKYPYTAGIIAIIWLGSAVLVILVKETPLLWVLGSNLITTLVIAAFGFRGKNES